MRLKRRNDATAAVMGCQMLSGFFTCYDLAKKAIWTLAAFVVCKTGKVARKPFPGVRASGAHCDAGLVELEFLARQESGYFLGVHVAASASTGSTNVGVNAATLATRREVGKTSLSTSAMGEEAYRGITIE